MDGPKKLVGTSPTHGAIIFHRQDYNFSKKRTMGQRQDKMRLEASRTASEEVE